MKTYKGITVVNPLCTKESKGLNNYHEWLQAFGRAGDDDALMGYLHTGFEKSLEKNYKEPSYSDGDRIIFYLSHADGWSDGEGLGNGENGSYDHRWPTPSKQRMTLAKKAITVLCTERFKTWIGLDPYEKNFIDENYISEKVLPVLMYFFSEEQRDRAIVPRNGVYRHSQDSHLEDVLRKFVLKLIKVILSWQPKSEEIKRFNKAKAWAVEMLCSMNEIDILRSEYRGVTLIDGVVVSALEAIERRLKIIDKGKGERLVKNHQEALTTGSKVAWLLHEYYLVNNCYPKEKGTQRLRSKIARG